MLSIILLPADTPELCSAFILEEVASLVGGNMWRGKWWLRGKPGGAYSPLCFSLVTCSRARGAELERLSVGPSLQASAGATEVFVVCRVIISSCLLPRHNDSIQCVSYNPITHQLASCSSSDIGRFGFPASRPGMTGNWQKVLKSIQNVVASQCAFFSLHWLRGG